MRDWIYQLIGQGVLVQVGDEYPILKLNAASWEVMQGQRSVRLVQIVRGRKGERSRAAKLELAPLQGGDLELFEALRSCAGRSRWRSRNRRTSSSPTTCCGG